MSVDAIWSQRMWAISARPPDPNPNERQSTVISQATDSGNFRMLLMATLVMAITVVTINRNLWRRLYALASTHFKLES